MGAPSPVYYADKAKKAGRMVLEAFAEGAGGRFARFPEVLEIRGVPIFWGVSNDTRGPFLEVKAGARPWLYVDHAYLGARGTFYRITRSATQIGLEVPGLAADPGRLIATRSKIRDWRKPGDFVLITPPGDPYLHLTGQAITSAEWVRQVERAVRAVTDRPVRIRFKPTAHVRVPAFADEAARAWCVVTHQSVTAVEALLAGVPVFMTTPHAAAAPLASLDLSKIETPRREGDREAWAAWLAANQWTLEEMRAGLPWRALMP
jgi:hypothetical protein